MIDSDSGSEFQLMAGRPVLEHEEEVLVTSLAKTSLRGPGRKHGQWSVR